jgi:glycosyltransferase involved in cell wall biosynthesis
MRTLMLVDPGLGRPAPPELRQLIDTDRHPDVLALEDALGATLLDERYLAAVGGMWGALLRRLPSPLDAVLEAFRRRRDYDVLVTWAERLAFPLAALLWLRRARTPHLAILFWVSKPKKAIPLRLLHRGMARVLLPDAAQRRFARQRLNLPEALVPEVRWGTDLRFWRPLGGPTDTIASVGREMRDYGTLIEALRGTDIPCHIAAGTVRDVANPWLDRLRGDQLPPRTVTVGRLSFDELRALYARARFVVVPLFASDNGNGQTAICEALAMGRPVLCSRIHGLDGVFGDCEAVRFFEPGDIEGLRATISAWWADPAGCDRLGAQGRAWVERRYPLDAWVTAVAGHAREALDEMRVHRRDRRLLGRPQATPARS